MKTVNRLLSPVASRALLASALLLGGPVAQAALDPNLAMALEGVWRQESPAISMLSDNFNSTEKADTLRYSADVRDTPVYVTQGEETTFVEYGRKRFAATESPWGSIPQLNTESAQLLEMSLLRKRYLVLSGQGKGLFNVGDWKRFGFLHVLDVSTRNAPTHYSLVAEAELGERVLGRLPGSSVLNYARLVPSRWASAVEPSAYEVSLYALKPKGPELVIANGKPLAYSLTRNAATWTLEPIRQTPVTDARDKAGRAYSAPTLPTAAVAAPTSATAEPVPSAQ